MFGFEYVCTCVVSLSANYSVSTWFSTGHAVVQYTSLSVTVSLFIFFDDLYYSLMQFPVVLQQVYTLVLLQEDNYNILATKKLVQYSKSFSYIFYNKLSSVHFIPRWRQLIIRAASLMPNWRRWKNSWRDSHYNVLNSWQKQETTN